MWILLRIWDLSLSFGQRSPVKGVFTKMEVRKFVQRLHGSYQNRVDKRPRYFSLFMANQKEIITTKLTDRVSVFFFPHWQYLVRFIYLLCRLVLRFAVVAGNSIHSSFFFILFLCLCFSFVFFFSIFNACISISLESSSSVFLFSNSVSIHFCGLVLND